MNNEEKLEQILEQIFDLGYATKEVEVGKKLKIVIKSLTGKDYLEIDPVLALSKGTKLYVLQKYGIAKLSRALLTYNGKSFKTVEAAQEHLENLPALIIDKLLKEHAAFEKEISEALNPVVIEESFFAVPGSAEKLEQFPKDLTSESQEA